MGPVVGGGGSTSQGSAALTPCERVRRTDDFKRATSSRPAEDDGDDDDGGLAVVRIKPLGAGGGGGERSATAGTSSSMTEPFAYSLVTPSVTVRGREWAYPRHVISPEMDQGGLFEQFMPSRVDGFFDGFLFLALLLLLLHLTSLLGRQPLRY